MRLICGAVSIACAFTLTSCATTAFDHQGSDAGYLVASMALPKNSKGFDSVCLRFRAKGDTSRGTVCARQRAPLLRPDMQREHEITRIEEGDFSGEVAVRALPPGDYELVGYTISETQRSISPSKPFSIPFRIRPGVPTYVGHYRWTFMMGKNMWGQDMVQGARMSVASRMARDMEKAAALRGIPRSADSAVPAIKEQ